MKLPLLIPFLFSGSVSLLMGQQVSQPSGVLLIPSGGKLNVSFEGKIRLAGGQPFFQPATPPFRGLAGEGTYSFTTGGNPVDLVAQVERSSPVVSFVLSPHGNQSRRGADCQGVAFEGIPGLEKGVEIWRYKPWNSWSKPVALRSISQMEEWDVQFFYWKYADGLYGAAVPLSGKGFRTTLGQDHGRFASRSLAYCDGVERDSIPQMTVGFGHDPYALFETLFEVAMAKMGHPENLRKHKKFPPVLENIGWCTWNSSDNGKNLNPEFLIRAARSFASGGFPIGWFLVDDGWLDQSEGRLNSFEPDTARFPGGFSAVVHTLKKDYHLKDVGVWHAFDGYWQGINPGSVLGRRYSNDLFTWKERNRPEGDSSGWRTCAFISPRSPALPGFFNEFHTRLKQQGFTFVKVDNQLVVERMAEGNFPIWDGAVQFHAALNSSVAATFDNTIINCMDMTPDAWCNFGTTAVARTSEDYFPYEKGETYDLQRGNAAAHVLQAVYNALYFSQVVYPDFDQFQSHNPNAVFHAIARAINDGPVYITDNIGEQKFDLLFPLVYSDGKIIRSDTPLLPAEDCLFQVQDARPFKAFSMAGGAGLLGVWNCADTDRVEGAVRPSDVHSIRGDRFALYEHFSRDLRFADRDEALPLSLGRLGCKLYYVLPLVGGNAAIGLVNKYNAPATLLRVSVSAGSIRATVYEGGRFAAVASRSPSAVTVDGKNLPFTFAGGLVLVDIPVVGPPGNREILITVP